MKCATIAIAMLLAVSCFAQDKAEITVGYAFLNQNTHLDFVDGVGNFFRSVLHGENGANAAFVYNLGSSHTLGIKADVSGYTAPGNFKTSAKTFDVALGPQIKKHSGSFNPFAEVLLGVGHRSISGLSFSGGQNAFTGIVGGGIDLKVSPRFSVRPIEADYIWSDWHTIYPTHVFTKAWATGQNNFRYVGGITFTF